MEKKYDIKMQYAMWVGTAALAVVVILTGVHLWREVETQTDFLQAQADYYAKTLANIVAPVVRNANLKQLDILVPKALPEENAAFVRITNREGKPLYWIPENVEPKGLVLGRQPIIYSKDSLGHVEFGVARVSMGRRLMKIVMVDLLIGLGLAVVFAAGSFWISAPIRSALDQLREQLRRIGAGEEHEKLLNTDLTEVDLVSQELSRLMVQVEEAQRKLKKAQTELKTAQKEMDEYTYVISHDLKEPLRGIEAFSKFLVEDYKHKLDEQGQYKLDVIRKSVVRMQRLINDLLKFSRLSQQKHSMEPIGFNTLLMRVRVNLQYALDAKKADLRVNRLPIVVCDETAMHEVFHNLISNAIKYNNNSLPVIEIGCVEKKNPDTNAPEYEFFVRDNGIGIKKEYFEKIFQIFQRLQRDDEGTGIGLTIVRRVIQWHGGRVWLESEEGKGTCFYFTLPKREYAKTGTMIDLPTAELKGTTEIARPV